MDLSRDFIILNGEAKTLQISHIEKVGYKIYRVRFKNNPRPYTYSVDNVTWLNKPEYVDMANSRVYINNILKTDIREALKFSDGGKVYWRVIHNNGFVEDDMTGKVKVVKSCLSDAHARNILTYLKTVASINPLRHEETGIGLLAKQYDKADFIDENIAAACFLNPDRHRPSRLKHSDLIFPFGCNASQKMAVTTAFEHQLSVIQGPPGTGKTQTILNIIANIVCQGKTVLVVSNNNSATANVLEKLEKYGLSFIVAPLGCKENRDDFIANQPRVPASTNDWGISSPTKLSAKLSLLSTLRKLDKVFALQTEDAELEQEQKAVELEWKHFCMANNMSENQELSRHVNSKRIISLWMECKTLAECVPNTPTNWFAKTSQNIKWLWLKWRCEHIVHTKSDVDRKDLTSLINELQKLYYLNLRYEISKRIDEIKAALKQYDHKELTDRLTKLSMTLFKASLADHYSKHIRETITNEKELGRNGTGFTTQYPVVLSTTFSARSCLFSDKPYDYVIMDEASQVSIETGFMALTCAYNAVIVGDTFQLPNVVTDEDKKKLEAIMEQYDIADGYNCAQYSFLQSLLSVVKNIPETLLREHYRCHPLIINFCNQKFYRGNLLIMTEDKGEKDVLFAVKTSKGNHCVNHYNQREIDVVKESILPMLKSYSDIGVISPYNKQVEEFHKQLPQVEAATIHKYQGRERDTIIFSVVDNQITDFVDDANMLNVAVSRAKKRFCLVVTGNEQEKKGNITDLLDYIAYNNCTVTESKLASIFDYLYAQYSEHLMSFQLSHPKISEYASENLTYALLLDILASDNRFNCLKVLCHIPLSQVLQDTSLMSEDELRYASNPGTHLDFLIINRASHKPILAVETDGYAFHNDNTEQHQRDMMKDNILHNYGLPILRLSTKGSGEQKKVTATLNQLI